MVSAFADIINGKYEVIMDDGQLLRVKSVNLAILAHRVVLEKHVPPCEDHRTHLEKRVTATETQTDGCDAVLGDLSIVCGEVVVSTLFGVATEAAGLWEMVDKDILEVEQDGRQDNAADAGIDAVDLLTSGHLIAETAVEMMAKQDTILFGSTMHALATRLQRTDLPLLASTFYSQFILPCRPADSTIDLKRTSYKVL